VRFDIEAGKETWILNAYETPAPDGNGLCTSQGKSWTVIRDAASGAATVKDQSDERLVYLGPDTGAQACADIPVARYTWVAAGVDLPSVRPLLQELSATAACAPSDRPGCGHWSKVDLSEDVVEQFSALPRTRVDSIYHRPDGRLSVVYGPFRNYAGMLDCVISFNADGSRNLDVLPPSL
jgi:hypothetical protein